MAGIGIGILSTFSLRQELAAGKGVLLDMEKLPLQRTWYAIHRRGKQLSPAAVKFMEFLQETGQEHMAFGD